MYLSLKSPSHASRHIETSQQGALWSCTRTITHLHCYTSILGETLRISCFHQLTVVLCMASSCRCHSVHWRWAALYTKGLWVIHQMNWGHYLVNVVPSYWIWDRFIVDIRVIWPIHVPLWYRTVARCEQNSIKTSQLILAQGESGGSSGLIIRLKSFSSSR